MRKPKTQVKWIINDYYLITLENYGHLAPGSIIRKAKKEERRAKLMTPL